VEGLSDGLTENLIAALSRVSALRVISWPSAKRVKSAERDVATLAGELNARYVLQGSVRTAERGLHITVQLTDAVNGIPVWGDSCGGTLGDLSDIEQRFARSIAEALLVTLSPTEERRIRRRAIPHAGAYECYLRAREAMGHDTPDGFMRAVSLLRSGLKVGGENALLYSTLGTVYARHGMQLFSHKGTQRRIEACARRALAIDPESAEALFLNGLASCRRGDLKEGVRAMLRALAIDPAHTDALYWCTGWLCSLGKIEIARPLAQRLLETDPLTTTHLCMPGWVECMSGRFEAALPWYRRWLNLEPGNPAVLHMNAVVLIWNQQFDEARAMLELLNTRAPGSPLGQFTPFIQAAITGNKEAAFAAVTPQVAAAAASFEVTCWNMGAWYAMVDARDEALDWLGRAVRGGFINYPMLAEYDPFLKRLRGEPRFTRLLDEVKREWEALQF
jgi:non-specific serine/threonine protein kinase